MTSCLYPWVPVTFHLDYNLEPSAVGDIFPFSPITCCHGKNNSGLFCFFSSGNKGCSFLRKRTLAIKWFSKGFRFITLSLHLYIFKILWEPTHKNQRPYLQGHLQHCWHFRLLTWSPVMTTCTVCSVMRSTNRSMLVIFFSTITELGTMN